MTASQSSLPTETLVATINGQRGKIEILHLSESVSDLSNWFVAPVEAETVPACYRARHGAGLMEFSGATPDEAIRALYQYRADNMQRKHEQALDALWSDCEYDQMSGYNYVEADC